MRHLIATLTGVALLAASAQVPALHIHAYSDHDHPEHHHSPAAHEHARADSVHDEGRDEDGAHVEACEPGQHSITVVLGYAAVPPPSAIDAESASPSILEPPIGSRVATDVTDIRVHGPPFRAQAPPRGPPLTIPA